jgi:DnaJ family protein C protein 28
MSNEEQKPKRTLEEWESAVEKQIREAMERGEFDHLPGAGKPLDLDDNPFTPDDMRMAYKVLKDNHAAPDWIEQSKEIRLELHALKNLLEQQTRWQQEHLAQARALPPDKLRVEREHLAHAREKTCRAYRQRAQALNQLIDVFNLKVPDVYLQVPRVRIDEELAKFIAACS